MIINILLALLVYLLALAVPIQGQTAFISYFVWAVIVFALAGFRYYSSDPAGRRWWL